MCKKLIFLMSFVLVLGLVSNASAQPPPCDILWDDSGDGHLWSTPENWYPDEVPDSASGKKVGINFVSDANCLIDPTVVDANCYKLSIGFDTGPCYMDMTGGSLTVGTVDFRIGDDGLANGIFNMSDGTVNSPGLFIGYNGDGTLNMTGGEFNAANISVADKAYSNGTFNMAGGTCNLSNRLHIGKNGNGTLNMTGGEISMSSKLELAKESSGNGWLYLSNGTINIGAPASGEDFEIAKRGTGTLTMTGGDVNVVDAIKMGEDGGTAHIDLHGGTINAGQLIMYDGTTMDITEGTMVLQGNETLPIYEYIGNGWITAYGGDDAYQVDVIYVGGDITETTVTASMRVPNLAWNPSPSDGVTVEWTPGPTLSWSPGRYWASHDVYFGTDEDDVNDANRANHPGLLYYSENQESNSYGPIEVELDTTYYWRIDEANDACTPYLWKGDVWAFTVADNLPVEDFESYNETDNLIEDTWVDNYVNGTGASVYLETSIVQEGAQSMRISYNNLDYGYSETDRSYVSDQNWTAGGVKALQLRFHGKADNTVGEDDTLYVVLKDAAGKSAVVTYGDPNDLLEELWQSCDIALQDFADANNVNLAKIRKVTIGIGERGAFYGVGYGDVYIDNIRLYPSRCLTEYVAGDITGDCVTDYEDVNIMTDDWLDSDYNSVGGDGVLENFPDNNSQWVDDPCRSRCLQFDGTNDWVDINDSELSDFHDRTISLWVNIRDLPDSAYPYVFCFQNAGDTPYRIYLRTRKQAVRVRFVEDYLADFAIATDEWHHLAFVIRDTAGNTCTGEFYGDGVLIDQLPGQPRHSGGASGVNLGSFSDGDSGFLDALYDEFRIYDYALSANEIEYLAEDGGVAPDDNLLLLHYKFDEVSGLTAKNSSTYEFYHPVLSAANIYDEEPQGDRCINFRDYAVMAGMWLEGPILWP